MSEISQQQQEALARRIAEGLQALDALVRRLNRTNAGLLISGVVTSAVSTLITGVTAAQGPVIGSGTEGWRMACIAASVFSFGCTLTVGLNRRLKIDERLAETRQCAGRLRALKVALETRKPQWDTVAREYEDIIRDYPELMA